MKKIFTTIVLTLLFVSAGFTATALSLKVFLSNIEIYTAELPNKGYVRIPPGVWQTVIQGKQDCYWVDFTRLGEAPRVGWKPAWNYIFEDLVPTVGNPPLTPEQETTCRIGQPVPVYVVQKNGTTITRPIYNGDLWLKTRDIGARWEQLQDLRVDVGAACESEIIRQTTFSYRWVTIPGGMRGLAPCVKAN